MCVCVGILLFFFFFGVGCDVGRWDIKGKLNHID